MCRTLRPPGTAGGSVRADSLCCPAAGCRDMMHGVQPWQEGQMTDYDTDILIWSERQAELLRRRAAGELVNEADLDWPNIAEEIESLGKTVARELATRVSTILIHLIKLEASPAAEPRIGWRKTIREQRDEIDLLLEDAPSLRPTIA